LEQILDIVGYVTPLGSNGKWSRIKPCAWCILHVVINWTKNWIHIFFFLMFPHVF
jgi:hypothetical protein